MVLVCEADRDRSIHHLHRIRIATTLLLLRHQHTLDAGLSRGEGVRGAGRNHIYSGQFSMSITDLAASVGEHGLTGSINESPI